MNKKHTLWSVAAVAAATSVIGAAVPMMAAENASVVYVGDTATLSVDVSGDATEGDLTVTRSVDGGEATVIKTIAAPVVNQTVSDTLPAYVTASAGTHTITYTVTDAKGVSKTTQTVLNVQAPQVLQATVEVMRDPSDTQQVYVDSNDNMFVEVKVNGFSNGDNITVERSIDDNAFQFVTSNHDFFASDFTDSIASASSYAGAQHSIEYRVTNNSNGTVASAETILDLSKNTTLKSVDFVADGSRVIEINENQSAVINFSMQTLNSGDPVVLYKGVDGAAATYFKSIPMNGNVQSVSDTISNLSVGTHTVTYGLDNGKNIEFTIRVKAVQNTVPTAYATLSTSAGAEQDVSLKATATHPDYSSGQVRIYRSIDGGTEVYVNTITANGQTQTFADKIPSLTEGSHKILYTYKTFDGVVVGYLDVSVTTEKANSQTSQLSSGTDKQYYTVTTGQSLTISGWLQAPSFNGVTTVTRSVDGGAVTKVWTGSSDGAKHTYTDTISGFSVGNHTVTYTVYDSGSGSTVTNTVTVNATAASIPTSNTTQTINGVENSTTPITLSGQYQSSGNTVYVTRSIDGGTSENVTSFLADGVKHTINDTLPTLSAGTHRIVYTFTCNNAVVGTSTVVLNVSSDAANTSTPTIYTQTPVVNYNKVATVINVNSSRIGDTLTIKRYVDGAYNGAVKTVNSTGSYQYITDEYTISNGTHTVYYSVTGTTGLVAFSKADTINVTGNGNSYSGSYLYASKPTISFPVPIISNYNVSANVIVNDNDSSDKLTVQRYVDGVLSKTFNTVSPNRTAAVLADNFILSGGTHTVYYTVTDLYGNVVTSEGYSITAPYGTVRPVSGQYSADAPILTIDSANKTYQSGKAPEVSLKLYVPTYGERVDLYYQIDNEAPVRFDTVMSRGGSVYVTAKLPNNLKDGTHNVVFYAVDSKGSTSSYNGSGVSSTSFKVNGTTPTIKVNSLVSDTVSVGEPIDIDFEVSGGSGEKLDVYYCFDSLPPANVGTYRAGESASVSIPTIGIDVGKHTLNIYAQDPSGVKSSVQTFNITYTGENDGKAEKTGKKNVISGDSVNNVPVVAANLVNTTVTASDQAVVNVSIVDKDEGEKISLYYSVDDGEDTLLTTFKSSGSAVNKSITLPKLPVGSHTVKIWAKDAKGDVSDTDYVTVSVTAATTAATITTNNPRTEAITITTGGKGTIKTGVEDKKDNTPAIVAATVATVTVIGGGVLAIVKTKKSKENKNKN